MSEATKIPFDSIPLDGATSAVAVGEQPRPSFSRSVPDLSTAGLLPPTRKPVAVTVPEPTPPTPPATTEPNPMASTPPPKAGSLRGFLWDLVRPTRTKWAILAGGVSLATGAYGLNLFMPTPAAPSKKKQDETAKIVGVPQVIDERSPPSVDEHRAAPPVAPKENAPAPLPVLSGTPEVLKPIIPVGAHTLADQTPLPVPAPVPVKLEPKETAPLPVPVALPAVDDKPKITPVPPPVSAVDDKPKITPVPAPPPAVDVTPKPVADVIPKPSGLPPIPVVSDKPNPEKLVPLPAPGPLPPVKPDEPKSGAIPIPKLGEQSETPPKPVVPVSSDKPVVPESPVPKPAFTEIPDPTKKLEPVPVPSESKPLPAPVEPKPVTPIPAPDVKLPPVSDPKLPVPLPPVGEVVGLPKTDKPAEGVPIPKPTLSDVKPLEAIPKPDLTGGKPVEPAPIPAPALTEKKPDVPPSVKLEPVSSSGPPGNEVKPIPIGVPAVGAKDPPSATVSTSPPKKGFEVDVVKVRATDTYTSISESFYQSKKYAAALRAFNGDMDISRMQEVEVPPLHELQKMNGVPTRGAEPTGGGRTAIPARGSTPTEPPVRGPVVDPTGDSNESVDWGPAGKRRPVVKYQQFTTPKEGMTPRDVARAVYADENEWTKLIGPRGARLRADDPLPRGTELTVPSEELPWK